MYYLNTAWAEKKRYYTARGARLDTYRAGNAMQSLVCSCFLQLAVISCTLLFVLGMLYLYIIAM